ncbi:unnamed protein product [Cylicocyclus nassatus]|uniref:Uncharacterized protein n=1 Tax=Cylicocyclus nassatus TaxID=53992 RepID=A0AA36HCY7_CYLNA|nr:unnamed protein product [Cylicocyclus nassatus]
MTGVLQTINDFSAHASSDQMSVLSPRLFSVVPHKPSSSEKQLLSPTILSFQKEGFLSMQELFEMATMNEKQQNLLLDMIMDVSGAGKAVEETLAKIKPEIEDVKNVKLPLVQELARKHDRWLRAHAKFTKEQRQEYEKNGFAFMNGDQLKLVYDSEEQRLYGINITELSRMTKEEKIKRIERDIRKLATLDRPLPQKPVPSWGPVEFGELSELFANEAISVRTRRQASGPPEGDPPIPGESEQELEERGVRINGILFQTLEPYAFEPEIGTGAALEVITLSPHAFIPEILFPRAFRQETLTPRAFIGAVLSPNALMARILSPTALRLEILSPRALHAWVLSPEALLVEILSPRMLDPRVLSPMALIVEVLSPGILSPFVGSAELGSVLVLSPHVLSPRYKSPEKMVIEVLSPHILGGPHSHEEAFHQVTEFGSHSPHYHGDSSHEREEGSHHSHELDNELSLESYPGLSSITGHIRHRHGGQGDARTGELFPGLADLLGGSHAENDPLSELLGLGAHSHHNHGPSHGSHGSNEQEHESHGSHEPHGSHESHGSHEPHGSHGHHEPELFPGFSELFGGGGHGGSHEPELAGLSELVGFGHGHNHGGSEHGNHGGGDLFSELSSLFGGHGSHSPQHSHSAHGSHAGAHSSHESHENHEESVPGLPPLIHIVNPLRQ